MPVVPGQVVPLMEALVQYDDQFHTAINAIGTVHYARIMLFDVSTPNLQSSMPPNPNDSYVLGVITEYDGSFAAYISDFVSQVGTVFDALLPFVVGGSALVPVANGVAAFQAFVAANDASQHAPDVGMFEAYDYTVQQILAAGS
jgi:hypothetical protein